MTTEPRRLGKYELRQRLARGGQGEVWKAFDLQLRRYVAVKLLHADLQSDPDFVSRFEREAQFIAGLHHPNIVQIHDFQFVHTPDSPTAIAYMVMEYIEGPTLAHYIRDTSRKEQFPPAADIVSIFTSVSLAIDYAHQKGMIHRDIKPANIILDKRNPHGKSMGEPILMDFGIAKLQGGADTTKVLGTPLYVSPEQAQGKPGDRRSDLYSLGIILYEITTGVTPFRGDSLMAILMQHYQDMPTPPALINPHIPPELSAVILKSIAKDPDARFPTASAMTIAMAEALKVPVPSELWRSSVTPAVATEPNAHNPLSLPPERTPLPLTPPLSPSSQSTVLMSPSVAAPSGNSKQAPAGVATESRPEASFPPASPQARKRSKKSLYIASLISLLVLISGLVGYVIFASKQTPSPPVISSAVVGHVLFLSSQNPPQALDEVQITSKGIRDAPTDKGYYAWLVTHDDSIPPVQWSLTVHNGSLSPPTYINPQHQDLLTPLPYLFLITLQSGNSGVPSFIANEHIYYAILPQEKSPVDHYSVVDHLNHLLTDDPNLEKLQMRFGLRYWLLKNTQALIPEVAGARSAWQNKDIPTLRQHLVNTVYYLEGTACAPSDLRNVPSGTSVTPDSAVAQNVRASLLDCPQNSILSGILAHIEVHMQGVVKAPKATSEQKTLAPRIQMEIVQVRAWLEQLHQDALQLLQLPDAQLLQPSIQPQIERMVTLANEVYGGQTTPRQAGAQQIGDGLQHLATFDILPCSQSSSNNVCMS